MRGDGQKEGGEKGWVGGVRGGWTEGGRREGMGGRSEEEGIDQKTEGGRREGMGGRSEEEGIDQKTEGEMREGMGRGGGARKERPRGYEDSRLMEGAISRLSH